MTDTRRIRIFDTTLRDGEQSPGASMNLIEKTEIAQALVDLGVDIIEAGFPIASPGDFQSVSEIAKTVRGSTVCGLARCSDKDIDRAWEALKQAEQPRIHVFLATSAIHREHKLKMAKEEIIKSAVGAIRLARELVDDVEFSPEDASRTELSYLAEVVAAAIEAGAEALVVTASGCGAHLHDYPKLLADEPGYSRKAQQLVDKVRDPLQILAQEPLDRLRLRPRAARLAVHTPCTLQHALKLNGAAEKTLSELGYQLSAVNEGHLCCGSAGTYSILQADLSQQLRLRKLLALKTDHPDLIVSANIGCIMHLAETDGIPVQHWLSVVAEDLEH